MSDRFITFVRILLTVVDHLHVVSRAGLTYPITARLAVDLSGSSLEDILDVWPSGVRTTRHERRTVTSTLLTTRDTRADKEKTLGLKLLSSANRVGVVRVTAVDDDVTRLQFRNELVNEGIDGSSGLDEQDDFAWLLELGNKFVDGVRALDLCAFMKIRNAAQQR